jgi:hypothetical protein
VASISDGARAVGLKDPRLSLTLPFWRTVTPVAHVVHCLRDPVEAAPSLSRWHPVDVETAGGLWLRYVVSACRFGDQLLVTHADVMARPVEVAQQLASALDLADPEAGTLEEVRTFVDGQLHRFRGGGNVDGKLALPSLLYALLVEGGLPAAMPLVELLHGSWLAEEELLRTRAAAGDVRQTLEELAAAERALRGRLAVRAALRLAQPAGPVLRRLRRRRRARPGG